MAPTEALRVGERAPVDIALPNQWGELKSLREFAGHNQVVFFYPMDDTPGCTVEGKEFRELHDQFRALDCVVIGISTDSVQSHQAYATKHGFPFLLLSDEQGQIVQAFGVLKDAMAERSTFVLDSDMRIRRTFRDVTPRGHAQQVLSFVRTFLESHRMLGG